MIYEIWTKGEAVPEQRPTPYAFLTEQEQQELVAAHASGKTIEYYSSSGGWIEDAHFNPLGFGGFVYRVAPEPEAPTIALTLTINGEPTSPSALSEQSWAALREYIENHLLLFAAITLVGAVGVVPLQILALGLAAKGNSPFAKNGGKFIAGGCLAVGAAMALGATAAGSAICAIISVILKIITYKS
jgi:hypothetical protein